MSLIILDRDGVINHDSADFIKSPAEWEPIAGSLEAIARLNQAGYRVVVITNQSGIARGLLTVDALCRIHNKMRRMLAQVSGQLEAILYSPYGSDDDCDCRKPKPGLFLELAQRLRIKIDDVPAIGDSLRDLQAAQAAGARPILVKTGNGAAILATGHVADNIAVYDDLYAAVNGLLETTQLPIN